LVVERVPPALARCSADVPVRLIDLSYVRSATEGGLELLQSYLVEALVDESERRYRDCANLVIWGSHLFPYGAACVQAKRILCERGIRASLIIFPVGSDIWEIGQRIPQVAQDSAEFPGDRCTSDLLNSIRWRNQAVNA